MRLFDTHCHLTDERFAGDLPDVIARMRAAGVARAVVIGDAAKDASDVIALARAHDFLSCAAGVHPHDASCWDDARAQLLRGWLGAPKMVALGEIGLDYHYDLSPRDDQLRAFDAQLAIAFELGLPAILHIREAHGEATELLRARFRAGALPRCVMHCYTGSWESAKGYLSMGMYISFTGAVTFKNAPKLAEVARNVPLDRLMLETDCPYMTPVPLRGTRNEPAYIAYTAEKIAALRAVPAPALAQAAYENSQRFFGGEGEEEARGTGRREDN
ncbi:MAG: TatD family hydrolase [Clostridia bacterium]